MGALLDSLLKNIGEALAVIVIYFWETFPVIMDPEKSFDMTSFLAVVVIVLTVGLTSMQRRLSKRRTISMPCKRSSTHEQMRAAHGLDLARGLKSLRSYVRLFLFVIVFPMYSFGY